MEAATKKTAKKEKKKYSCRQAIPSKKHYLVLQNLTSSQHGQHIRHFRTHTAESKQSSSINKSGSKGPRSVIRNLVAMHIWGDMLSHIHRTPPFPKSFGYSRSAKGLQAMGEGWV